jgi:mannosyltransferase OCH1-like enzyme
MRRGTIIFVVINLIVIGSLINQCGTLIALLFENASRFAIPSAEITAPDLALNDSHTQLIPKIIHQTYINSSIPAKWKEGQQRCVDLHEDYEYIVRPLSEERLE